MAQRSPAARGRELKQEEVDQASKLAESPAARGRELKPLLSRFVLRLQVSPAARGRELKLLKPSQMHCAGGRPPRAGVS